jgi:hypothetical protein
MLTDFCIKKDKNFLAQHLETPPPFLNPSGFLQIWNSHGNLKTWKSQEYEYSPEIFTTFPIKLVRTGTGVCRGGWSW